MPWKPTSGKIALGFGAGGFIGHHLDGFWVRGTGGAPKQTLEQGIIASG